MVFWGIPTSCMHCGSNFKVPVSLTIWCMTACIMHCKPFLSLGRCRNILKVLFCTNSSNNSAFIWFSCPEDQCDSVQLSPRAQTWQTHGEQLCSGSRGEFRMQCRIRPGGAQCHRVPDCTQRSGPVEWQHAKLHWWEHYHTFLEIFCRSRISLNFYYHHSNKSQMLMTRGLKFKLPGGD